MATQRINILVYSGPGSTVDSVRQCLFSLRRLLSPNYVVIPVTDSVILKEPWTKSCALLVFPGGADTAYCRSFNGDGNRIIDQFVHRGGAFLGLCAGGYYGSSRCEFEVGNKSLEVVGLRELSFFPGCCRGCAFKGFEYQSEAGARAAEVAIPQLAFKSSMTPNIFKCYYNGGGVFVDANLFRHKGVEVLANYTDSLDVDGGNGSAAVVYCKIGQGGVILSGLHPEFAAANLDTKVTDPKYLEMIKVLKKNDDFRVNFLKSCLKKLGLIVSQEELSFPSLSQLHLSSLDSRLVSELLTSWKPIITSHERVDYLKGGSSTFCLKKQSSRWTSEPSIESMPSAVDEYLKQKETDDKMNKNHPRNGDADDKPCIIQLVSHEIKRPEAKETPFFNHQTFYENLTMYQKEKGSEAKDFGKYLMYGEVVTSTNTMLEKNPQLLNRVPTGFTFTATTQIAGRGRGSNPWVCPVGSLVMSVYIKHPMILNSRAPVIFIQYIAAIAIIEGIHSYDKRYDTLPVKLKWPNDIYVKDSSKISDNQRSYVKIGGILVNSSYSADAYDLVVGIGLNTSNAAPTTSLNAVLSPEMKPFTVERLIARILTRFEDLYKRFCRCGFDPTLQALYYKHWLHTNQIVTLEAEGGLRARIKGITSNFGLLKVEELGWDDRPTGKLWELQSDSNSFDFFKGLLKKKELKDTES